MTNPATVKWLKIMVFALTATMIVGFLVIIAFFAMNFRDFRAGGALDLPDRIELPPDAAPAAFTQGKGWYAVVTETDEILVFDQENGRLLRRIELFE